MAAYRLFFAIELAASLKTSLLSAQYKLNDIVGIPVAAENFHITLSFLGEQSEKKLEAILDGFNPPQQAPFELELGELIYWPKPQISAIEIPDPQKKLLALKKNVDQQLAENNQFRPQKRDFKPHITLFRQVSEAPKYYPLKPDIVQVSEISLMLSQNAPRGIYYETLETWPLSSPHSLKQQILGKR